MSNKKYNKGDKIILREDLTTQQLVGGYNVSVRIASHAIDRAILTIASNELLKDAYYTKEFGVDFPITDEMIDHDATAVLMEEKILWFGRYLGCKMKIYYSNGSTRITKLNSSELQYVECCYEVTDYKLILKEIEDITEADAIELNDIRRLVYMSGDYDRDISELKYVCEFLSEEIDFLRSKGYAIGIPKEYYITEKELEEK